MKTTKPATSKPTLLRGGRLTKVNGILASCAPQVGEMGVVVRPLVLAVSLAIGGAFMAAPNAWAGSCLETLPGSSQWVCSGPAGVDTTQFISTFIPGNISVTTTPGFGLAAAGFGFYIANNSTSGNISFLDENKSSITATRTGIDIRQRGNGSISVTSTGNLVSTDSTGVNRSGIDAVNYSPSSNITVTALNTQGGLNGIRVANRGLGSASIVSTGVAKSTGTGYGIVAGTGSLGVDLTIESLHAYGFVAGIRADNFGTGSITIKSSGNAVGSAPYTFSNGIVAKNFAAAKDIVITSLNASGGGSGIFVDSRGSGKVSITSTGTTIGTLADGIFARNTSNGTSMSITIGGATTGGQDGIDARNNGKAGLTINANANVTGNSGMGIRAFNSANDVTASMLIEQAVGTTTTGAIDGINADNAGGSLTINALGTSVGTAGSGINAINQKTATSLTVTSANATGGYYGIYADNGGSGDLTLNSTGMATGTGEYSTGIAAVNRGKNLNITANTVTGGYHGISASNSGTGQLNVESTGMVTGTRGYAVTAGNAGTNLLVTVVDAKGAGGIFADNAGSGELSVTSTGTVESTSSSRRGIVATNGTAGTNLAIEVDDVVSRSIAIDAINNGTGEMTITSTGSVTSTNGYGIRARNNKGTDLTISVVDVSGRADGIDARNLGTGALTITATGLVEGAIGQSPAQQGFSGIDARNSINGTDLVVKAHDVIGNAAYPAIRMRNYGSGVSELTVSGNVSAVTAGTDFDYGASLISYGTELSVTTLADSLVTGGATGIGVLGLGPTVTKMSVVADGKVVGYDRFGIRLSDGFNAQADMSVTATDTFGGIHGIFVSNFAATGTVAIGSSGTATGGTGSGIWSRSDNGISITSANAEGGTNGIFAYTERSALTITTTGTTKGTLGDGIYALNTAGGTSLSIKTGGAVSGGNDGIDARNFGTAGLTITAEADVTGYGGMGIRAFNSANDVSASMLINQAAGTITTGAIDGINADNAGGSLTINALGTSIGDTGSGISALNRATATDLTITSAIATGGQNGIFARNYGTGELSITATGAVEGTTNHGIYARNEGTDLTIDAATVSGGQAGIVAFSPTGTGSISVTASGHVNGSSSHGIYAFNQYAGSEGASISAKSVYGYESGIWALNNGTEALLITATGTVEGATQDGIYARNTGYSTNISVDTVIGGRNGIDVAHQPNTTSGGPLTLIATGDISGTTGYGVFAINTGTDALIETASVTGGTTGIYAYSFGTGSLTITANDDVTGLSGTGIRALNSAKVTTTSMLITQAAGTTTTGEIGGIYAANYGGSLTINALGTSISNNFLPDNFKAGSGIYAKNGDPTATVKTATDLTITSYKADGERYGIVASNNGSGALSITSTSSATGKLNAGIAGFNAGTSTTVEAVDTSGYRGILVSHFGTGAASIISTGTATGTGGQYSAGIELQSASGTTATIEALNASGTFGGIIGFHKGSGALSITATGTVTGSDRFGIYGYTSGSSLTVTSNVAEGGRFGIQGRNYGTGSLTITTTGLTTGDSVDGIYAINYKDATSLTVIAGSAENTLDAVTGGDDGIDARNYGTAGLTISANADVTGKGGMGIRAFNSANDTTASMVINQAAGTTTTGAIDGINANNAGGSLTINALGTSIGTAGSGIKAINQTTATDLTITSANATGDQNGIKAFNAGSGDLTITTTGTTTGITTIPPVPYTPPITRLGTFNSGIYAVNNGTGALSITTGGATTGGNYGIFASNKGKALSITTNGTTTGSQDGIYAAFNNYNGSFTITANADVTGTNGNGIFAVNAISISPMTIKQAAGTTTTGSDNGIYAKNFGGSIFIDAQGTSSSSSGNGILAVNYYFGSAIDVTTSSFVAMGAQDGIRVEQGGSGAVSITTTGTTTGTNGDGIYVLNNTASTAISITTSGTVTGGNDGIDARNNGTGYLTITADEDVTGQNGMGIRAFNSTYGTTLDVTANNVSGAVSGIETRSYGSGGATINLTGTAQGGSGAAIDTYTAAGDPAPVAGSLTTINLAAGAQALAGASGIAIRNNEGNSILNVADGASIIGAVSLAAGSDLANLSGTNVLSGITVLDGGDDASSADGMIDVLTINGATATTNAGQIINWEVLNLNNSNLVLNTVVTETINTCGGSTTLGGNSAANTVLGCISQDQISLTDNTQIAGNIEGAGGADTIQVLGNASVGGSILGGGAGQDASAAADTGDTILINTTGTVGGVDAGLGADLITMAAGTVTNTLSGGSGNDTIVLNGGSVGSSVQGGDGDDVINWNSASFTTPVINGGLGSDIVNINNAAIVLDGTLLDGGDDASTADGMIDVLTINGVTATVNGGNITNWEVLSLNDSDLELDDIETGEIQVCVGSTTLSGSSTANNVLGCISQDQITLTDNTQIAGNLEGAGGADTIQVLGNASVGGTVMGGGAGQDNSASADTGNTILINTTGTVGGVDGGLGADLITMVAGTVTNVLTGGSGNDTIVLNGGSVGSSVQGGDGDDLINWNSAAFTTPVIAGGLGSDTLNINDAATILGSTVLDGGDDASTADGMIDVLTINGTTATVNAGQIINWEVINVINPVGADLGLNDLVTETLNACGGSTTLGGDSTANDVLGCIRNDQITATGDTQIAGNIEGAGGSDTIQVLGHASVGGSILGGYEGQDNSAEFDTGDTILVNTTGTVGGIDAGLGDDRITLVAGTVTHSVQGGEGDDVMDWNTAAFITPSAAGGLGSDTVNINDAGTVLSGVVLDGGDDTSSADGMIDTLNLNDRWSGSLTGASTINWEVINLNGGTLAFSDATISAGQIKLNNGATLDASNSLQATADIVVDTGSRLMAGNASGTNAMQITGKLSLAGSLDLRAPDGISAPGDTLAVSGDFTGTPASSLQFDTLLGGSNTTDLITIGGNLNGSGTVVVNNVGGSGSLTTDAGIKLIDVTGAASNSSATLALASPVTAGLFSYTLRQGGNGGDAKDWYLMGSYNAAVPGYVLGQQANMQAGLNQVGTLHQRMGEQRHADTQHKQVWMRLLGDTDRSTGSADWSYDQRSYGLQLGVDLMDRNSEASDANSAAARNINERAGINFNYRNSNADFKDKTRSFAGLGHDTGDMNSKNLGLGAYYTRLDQDGTYLDLVGNIGQLSNDYSNIETGTASQSGWQANVSAEVGKPMYQSQDGWQLEPQAQLIYQNSRYDGFTDRQFEVAGYSADQLRGRIGLRLFKDGDNKDKPNNYYMIANLTHDFLGEDVVRIDNTPVSQGYDRTRAEIGVGAQSKFSDTGYFYIDARYNQSFDGNSKGGQANVGVKFAW